MLFSSITFLYVFLPVVVLLYFVVPFRGKNFILLVSSLVFYAWGEPKYVLLMLFSIWSAWITSLWMEALQGIKRTLMFAASVSVSLILLLVFKYADFFVENWNLLTRSEIPLLRLTLPIGISFYTFQIISYTVDVYRGNCAAQRNVLKLGTYVTMFPQLIAGPIVRYLDVEKELAKRNHSLELVSEGVLRFCVGLGKKILLANVLGEFCNLYRISAQKSMLFAWGYAFAFCLHIYYDFSGYSDMAIGLGKLFGFSFPENFNYPYISKSVTEFWRRWHMSLGGWFRDYVYIPLGGNRVGKIKWLRNIFVVWFLTGFWHGAAWNFILWGLYFGVILVLEKSAKEMHLFAFAQKRKVLCAVLQHLYVILLLIFSFVIFNGSSMAEIGEDFQCLFGAKGLASEESLYYLSSYKTVFLIGMIGVGPWIKEMTKWFIGKIKQQWVLDILQTGFVLGILILCTAYLIDGSFNPFLYFRF